MHYNVSVTEVANESEATIIIRWGELPESEALAGTKSVPIPSHCSVLICWYMPKEIILNEKKASEFHITLDENVGQFFDLYSIIAHELGHVLGLREYHDPNYPEDAVTDDVLKSGEKARVLREIDKAKIKERHPECAEEECSSIAGTWSGTSSAYEDSLPITLSLSQDKCNITGTVISPESCPSQCGFQSSGSITGSVNGNTFSFIIAKDPWVDCDTCKFICYGTDQGSLTVNGNRMYGTAKVEDCEDKTFINATLDLTRSSSTYSLTTLGKKKDIRKSSILSSKSCSK